MKFKEQKIFFGYDSYLNIEKILLENNVKKPFLVCDSAFDYLFIKDYFENSKFSFVYFNDFTPNPQFDEIVKGVKLFRKEKCDFIISVGGGSAIDVAKCIKLYCKMNDDTLYLQQEYFDSEIPHMAIPTTAGTGSESTRYAVCYYEGAKQSVTHESIIPEFVILEPNFLSTLPSYQKKATLLDALCQGIESLWSVNSTTESEEYSISAITTILANIDAFFSGDKLAAENICMAANLAGRAINITQTTAAHAMSYKITSLYGIPHGHAVAVCLPYVWRYMLENIDKCIDSRGQKHLLKVFDKLNELFFVDEHKQAVYRFFRILKHMEMDFPTLGSPEDMSVLVNSVNPVRLKNNPVALDIEAISEIYMNIFTVGNNFQKKNIEKFLKKYHTTYEVKELQQFALNTLHTFDEFCKNNKLKYFLSEGTLLGAARHQGFVPWDDDIDVVMPREDYDRFIKISSNGYPKGYVLDSFETNPKHWTICAKLLISEKNRFELKRLDGIALSTSPGIDVFPLDTVPDIETAISVGKKIKLYRVMLWLRTGYSHDYSTIKWKALKILSYFYSVKGLHKRIQTLMKLYNGAENGLYVNYGSLYNVEREVFNKKLFSSKILLNFEDSKFPVPKGYREVLETIYGDYNKLPPYSKRFPKHSYFVNIE